MKNLLLTALLIISLSACKKNTDSQEYMDNAKLTGLANGIMSVQTCNHGNLSFPNDGALGAHANMALTFRLNPNEIVNETLIDSFHCK